MENTLNKVKGYRVMSGFSQDDMAEALNITRVSYMSKENGKAEFKQAEMIAFMKKIQEVNPNITLNDIFM